MSVKILISPDSFKECISSVRLSSLIKEELVDLQSAELIVKPISDGGDGFLEVCKFHFGGEILNYKISTAYDNSELICPVLYNNESKTVYIESANVLGLKVIPVEFRKPLKLTSKGLGEILIKIENDIKTEKISVEKVRIGIGGTATTDMGVGACSALGLKLYDKKNTEIFPIPENFNKVKKIAWDNRTFPFQIDLIIDVDNVLLGKDGAVMVFGKQKGASKNDKMIIENGFNNIVNLLLNNKLIVSSNKLYGAGGGIPSLLHLFVNAEIKKAKDFILNDIDIRKLKGSVDFAITGEGAFDNQSLMGKGAGIILREFEKQDCKIFLLCGIIINDIEQQLSQNILPIELNKFFENIDESILNIESGIRLACIKIKNNL